MLNKGAWKKYLIGSLCTLIGYAIIGNSNLLIYMSRSALKLIDFAFNLVIFGLLWLAIRSRRKQLEAMKTSADNKKIKIFKILEMVVPVLVIYTTVMKLLS